MAWESQLQKFLVQSELRLRILPHEIPVLRTHAHTGDPLQGGVRPFDDPPQAAPVFRLSAVVGEADQGPLPREA